MLKPMLKVLYIDDDETNHDIAQRILNRAPFEMSIAHADNAAEGMAKARELIPDLILMDFHMPGMSGADAVRELREDDTLSHTRFIAVTADIYSREEFEDAGCDHYLTKPVRKNKLLQAIKEVFPDLEEQTK